MALIAGGLLLRAFRDLLRNAQARARELFEYAPEGIFVADADGRCVDVNEAGCVLLGYSCDELIGRPVTDIVAPAERTRLQAFIARADVGSVETGEWRLRHRNGGDVLVEVIARTLPDGRRQAFVHDISERRRMERELRQAAIVFDNAKEGVVVTGPDARIVRVNRAYSDITGYSPEEVIGRNPRLHKSGRHDRAFYAHMWDSLLHGGYWQGEIWNRRKNGELYPAWSTITAMRDEQGRLSHFVALFSDISIIKQSEQRLSELAHHDALTGLPNRLLFDARLEQALERARRHRQRVALLFLDLDRFKQVNDSLGHAAGDQLLQTVATRLREAVRAEDTVARLGGDEFTVIMEELQAPDDAARLARKLIARVRRPARIEGQELRSSTSVGIALYPEDAEVPADLIRAADAAMYRAKMGGRGTFEFHTPELTPATRAVQREERERQARPMH